MVKYTVEELRVRAREKNIRGRSTMNKAELLKALNLKDKSPKRVRATKENKAEIWSLILSKDHKHSKMNANLKAFKKEMDREGIFFWLGEGTALGAIREGKIIKNDTDIDVGIWHEDRRRVVSKVVPRLVEQGFKVGRVYPFSIYRDGEYIDLDFTGKGKRCMAFDWPKKCDTFIDLLEPFGTAKLNGVKYNVPNEAYIRFLYGETWRVPQNVKPKDVAR